ncbi:MAG: glycosyl transferase, partial [Cyanobacteriota bacterium]|nr:glycosyl transferase [Cyanobacteriota bacterium]
IAKEACDWLDAPERLEGQRQDLQALRGEPGAVAALAAEVRGLLPRELSGS